MEQYKDDLTPVDLTSTLAPFVGMLRMSTPSRSRLSTMGSECYFDWRENMERCQQESKWQVQSLFHETRRFREENEVLCIQVSSSGPLVADNLKTIEQTPNKMKNVSFPKNARFLSGSQEIRPKEKFPPVCQALLDESSNSTCISIKKRWNKMLQLSDAMWAWLGPQTPTMEGRPCTAAA